MKTSKSSMQADLLIFIKYAMKEEEIMHFSLCQGLHQSLKCLETLVENKHVELHPKPSLHKYA